MAKKAPVIRFKDFEDDWEQRKLKDLAEINPKSSLPDKFQYVDLESVVGTELIAYRTETRDCAPSRAQRLAKTGDIFYQTVRPYQKNNYLFNLPYQNYVFSTGYAQLRPFVDSSFLFTKIQEEGFVTKVLDRCTGTSYPAINASDLASIEVRFPTIVEEQTRIGNFFQALDNVIALHQRKSETLESLKQAFIQKLFPKKDLLTPSFRFKNFERENWKKKKLGELLVNGSKDRVENPNHFNRLTVKLHKQGLEKFDADRQLADSRPFYKRFAGEIIVAKQNYFNGGIAIVNDEFDGYICSNAIMSFSIPGENVHFIFENISRDNFIRKNSHLANGTGQKELSEKDFLSFEIELPSRKEQALISEFIAKINNTINNNSHKINKLKKIKASLLEKMFI